MKLNTDILTRYLHRLRNQPEWMPLNEVATSLNIDRATSRRYTNMVVEWGLVERQQIDEQPTQVRATDKLIKLEPGEVRRVVEANCNEEPPLL